MQSDNRYVIDPNSPAELARLQEQDHLYTQAMGGLFPEQSLLSHGQILDLACGPGGWPTEVAKQARSCDVIGIDISAPMIEYAKVQAQAMGLKNISFQAGNILDPLPFPDGSFDLVNGRFLTGFMKRSSWPVLLKECWRILKPGGICRLTEAEVPVTNSAAHEKLCHLLTTALYRIGNGFSEYQIGTVAMLRRFLMDAEYQDVQEHPSMMNMSSGSLYNGPSIQNNIVTFTLLRPFLLKLEVITADQFDRLYEHVLKDMHHSDYCAIAFINTIWGRKS
jgi:ubiquinone/menaquinone biosynthesis C-methylase UbiE